MESLYLKALMPKVVKRFGMQTSKIARTPMSTTAKLSCDDLEERVVKISIERLLEAKFTLVCQTYV